MNDSPMLAAPWRMLRPLARLSDSLAGGLLYLAQHAEKTTLSFTPAWNSAPTFTIYP